MNAATGGTFTLTKSLGVGEEITIEIGQLNESMVYNFKVGQPDGTNFSKERRFLHYWNKKNEDNFQLFYKKWYFK